MLMMMLRRRRGQEEDCYKAGGVICLLYTHTVKFVWQEGYVNFKREKFKIPRI
jgi:hypothetical protein